MLSNKSIITNAFKGNSVLYLSWNAFLLTYTWSSWRGRFPYEAIMYNLKGIFLWLSFFRPLILQFGTFQSCSTSVLLFSTQTNPCLKHLLVVGYISPNWRDEKTKEKILVVDIRGWRAEVEVALLPSAINMCRNDGNLEDEWQFGEASYGHISTASGSITCFFMYLCATIMSTHQTLHSTSKPATSHQQ